MKGSLRWSWWLTSTLAPIPLTTDGSGKALPPEPERAMTTTTTHTYPLLENAKSSLSFPRSQVPKYGAVSASRRRNHTVNTVVASVNKRELNVFPLLSNHVGPSASDAVETPPRRRAHCSCISRHRNSRKRR